MATTQKIPFWGKLLYGFGDSTFSLLFTTLAFYFLFFLTDGVGLSPALAGWVFFVGKMWDAFSDPLIGHLSDHTKTRWGRRRPFLLFGGPLLAISFMLLWQKYPIHNEFFVFIIYTLLAVLFFTCFTSAAVPYAALVPELTLDYDERTALVSYRMFFSITFSVVAAALPMTFVEAAGNDIVKGFQMMALVFGLFSLAPLLTTFFGIKEKYRQKSNLTLSIKDSYRQTIRNRPFRFVMGIFLLSWATIDLIGVVFVYFVTYVLNRKELTDLLFLVIFGVAIIFLPFWYQVSKKIGKRITYIAGMAFWSSVLILLLIVPAEAPIWVFITICALSGIGLSTAHVIPWAMIPECVDFDELQTGKRREGMYTGFITFLQKLASSVAILLVGLILSWSGYKAGGEQTAGAQLAIRLLLGLVPAIMLTLSMILAYYHPITRQKHREILDSLASRKQANTMGGD